MAVIRGLLLILLFGSTTACVGPLRALEPLRPLAPEPVCTNGTVEAPPVNGSSSPTSHAYSECSVSLMPGR
jgi:hypothetical protein